MVFETIIGLEVHAHLLTRTKIFCGCAAIFGDEHNTRGCPVCLGLPGSLPTLNRRAVEMAVRMGLAVGCSIASKSVFARKNYFYPDLPKGYQISQYDKPLCEHGTISIEAGGKRRTIGITRIHLEEDAGKLIHDEDGDSLFDVNRCGTPLIEIVSDPDMRTPQEAYAYLTAIKQILEYLEICDGNMEEGSLRCDANVSIRPVGQNSLGVKIELKNMNSFRGVEKAIEYEARRQQEVIQTGGKVVQETYAWDAQNNRTIVMRSKEDAHDYRYFPEPDLLPLVVEDAWVDTLKKSLPELPHEKQARFMSLFGLTSYMAEVLSSSRDLALYFEETLSSCNDAKLAAHWVMGEVLRLQKEKNVPVLSLKISPKRLGNLLSLVSNNTISANAAKKVFDLVEESNKDPETIIEEQGLKQISNLQVLEDVVHEIIARNTEEVARYKAGEGKLMGFFVGEAMKTTKGNGNPREINKLFSKFLESVAQ
jgi:aspartyl-tRNA(Asn)/glutamyl-tRNA(Gln) amidotransferase subunit B